MAKEVLALERELYAKAEGDVDWGSASGFSTGAVADPPEPARAKVARLEEVQELRTELLQEREKTEEHRRTSTAAKQEAQRGREKTEEHRRTSAAAKQEAQHG